MQLTFLGAANMVTGSSYLLETADYKLLIDCGMFQGSKVITALNRREFAYDPTTVNAVLLSHAHIDHSGLLPKLCKQGFKGPVYATKVTTELCGIMLPDSAHIQEFDAEIANRKGLRAGRKPVEPLYTVPDAYEALKQFSPVAYGEKLALSEQITVRFQDAGHIMGSSMIEVWVTEGNETVKLLFSGDLGQPDQPLIKDPTYIDDADYIIMESTYGNKLHSHEDRETLLKEIINDTVRRGGNVIIPSFAVGRTQTILYHLHNLLKKGAIPDIPVIIDSPLAIKATNIFMHNPQDFDSEAYDMVNSKDNPLALPKLKFTQTAEESKTLNSLDEPAVIISASGMADAGRILHHLKHNLWRPESSVLFVGYQAQGSMGRRLLDGVKRVKIMGEQISVKAQIYNIDGFSAHADKDQLMTWLKNFKCQPANVFVVHGEHDSAANFAELIESELHYSAYIPQYGAQASITGRVWDIKEVVPTEEEPAVKELLAYLAQFERDYMEYKNRLQQVVANDSTQLGVILQRLDKAYNYFKKIFNFI